jgi:hypothetical protein
MGPHNFGHALPSASGEGRLLVDFQIVRHQRNLEVAHHRLPPVVVATWDGVASVQGMFQKTIAS